MDEQAKSESAEGGSSGAEAVGDALRTAVERTLAATADSATETRQRAQSLLDDVVRRGQVARDEVTKRGEEATSRLAEAISELRRADDEEAQELRGRLAIVERRLAALEARVMRESNPLVEGETEPQKSLDERDPGD